MELANHTALVTGGTSGIGLMIARAGRTESHVIPAETVKELVPVLLAARPRSNPAERVDQFISEVRRVVAPGGRFICSTPQSSHGALVPWHVKEYSVAELRALLERHFSSVEILSSQSDGRLSEDPGQKMVALCR